MEEKSNSANHKKEDSSSHKQSDDSQKITNFFPLLKTEGRAKMCGLKTDDSKQKEMLKKIKGKESMTLRSKRLDKIQGKSVNGSVSSQGKEKVRNISVASALKTPLSQVLRKSIEASDKKDSVKLNQTKILDTMGKSTSTEIKKSTSDSDSGMMLRQKVLVPEKPLRSNTTAKRRSEGNQIAAGNDKVATPSNTAEVKPHPARGRPPKVVTYAVDIMGEEGKSDSASVNSNNGSKAKKTYRKRHFRGSTYGLYLTPARKKKKKLKSQDESKDDECSVTSTENNSFLDSEDGNSLVSEDCFTPSEKSLVDEEHGLESQNSSTVLSIEKKCDSLGINSSIESEELNSSFKTNKDVKPEPKIEISADYEENTQNVTDLFQDLEEMQWEAEQKGNEEVDNTNGSQTNKTPQYDDISSESFTNSLHFSFKKNSPQNSEETCTKDDLMVEDKCEEPASVSMSSNCDISDRADHQKIDLPETSETCLSINDNISEMFDLKDDSNVASSDISENKDDLNLISSDLSEIKDDLNLESTDMLISKDSLNLVFSDVNEDKQDSNLISSDVPKPKELNLDSALVSEKKCDVSQQSFDEKKKDSNLVSDDVNEHKNSEIIQNDVTESKENNKSDSLSVSKSKENLNSPSYNDNKDNIDSDKLTFSSQKLDSQSVTFTNENKLDSNSPLFSNENKQDSNSVPFSNENKQDSNSLSFSNENKQDSNSLSFINETKQDSNSMPSVENKSISNSPLFVSEKESDEPMEHSDGNKNELIPLDSAKSTSGEVQDETKDKNDNLLDSQMEVDNLDSQNDESDAQSTIATCVKSRQRIKRRFTDDIVDTDLGILSAAAMASVNKKAMTKQETHKDIIENFQAVSRSEVKKVGPVAKIECVFNYKQAPIKSCTCGGETYQAKTNDQNEEVTFCQAVDTIDDKLVGCCNPVVTSQLVRPSVKLPFITMCENHLWRLKHHHACPYCGLFCSQGSFIQCTNENNSLFRHFFHEQCQSKEDGSVPFCFHCGSSSSLKLVYVDMQMVSPPSFFLNQAGKVSVPDVSKARISFSESSDFTKKEDDEPSQTFRIEDSGKVLSLAGLPKGSSKEELEKLISVLNEEKVRSCNYPTEELYDMAATGNVLKILYMLAKGLDPNQKFENHEGETALHAAAANGHVTVVHLLVQAGATRESLNEKMYTPLMLAVENGHKDVVYYLVKKGALTDFKGENGMSSLHLAAKSGNLDVLKILMSSRNVDINAQDDGGWTPIVWASEHDHLTVVNYLLKRGANPNLRDNEGNIGLHWSAFSGSVEISYLYLDYGCDINSVNELGDTPLHIAARQDSFPCVTLFLSRGADVTILNKAGKLPAECCIDRNSDTYLSLSLNLLLKKITGKYQHKAEKILHRDISRGKEQLAIQCVNAVDDEMPPLDFLYVTENCETMPIKIDRTITSLQSCHCEDDCSTASCSCASISYQCWYDKEGLLLPEFNLIDPPMLFECNRACSCWSLNCHNRVLQNGITCRLQLIRTKGKGWGVRTLKDIPKGAFICEYVGELISDSAADKRADDSYLFDLDNRDGETYCLDARYYGNISRFINHLCEPNLVPVKVYVDHQDLNFPRIAFFSSRDIKQYEELGFDYGEKFWAIKYKSFTCECGTPKCKYSKESIHITLSNYYRRLKEEQMEEAAAAQQPEVIQTE